MGQLTNLYVSQSYQGLLKLANSTTGLTPTLQTVQDGLGGNSPLQISQTEVNISGSFYINNVPITNGTNGTSGTSGINGTSGTSGSSGSNGSSGSSGTSGSDGSSGTSGSSGVSGTSGTSGSSGGTGSSGTAGTSGTSGSSGSNGSSGSSGSNGSSGTSGSNGSSGTSGSSGIGTNGTSGTSGQNGIAVGRTYYFNQSQSSDVSPYKVLSETPTTGSTQTVTVTVPNNSTGTLVSSYITPQLGFNLIPAGVQRFHLHFLKPAANDDVDVYVTLQLANSTGGTIGPLITSSANYITWNSGNPSENYVDVVFASTTIDPTNRMIVKIYLNNNNNQSHNVTYYTEDGEYSYVITSVGVTSGSSGTSGTSGTSPLVNTGSFATTGSNQFIGNQGIFGDVSITGSLNAYSASITYLQTVYETSSVIYSSGSNQFGDEPTDLQLLYGKVAVVTGSLEVTGALKVTGSGIFPDSSNGIRFPQIGDPTHTYNINVNPGNKLVFVNSIGNSHMMDMDTGSIKMFYPVNVKDELRLDQDLISFGLPNSSITADGNLLISSIGTGSISFNVPNSPGQVIFNATSSFNELVSFPGQIEGNVTVNNGSITVNNSFPGLTLQTNPNGSGSAYNITFAKVDNTTDPTNVFSAVALIDDVTNEGIGLAYNSYTPYYSGSTAMIYAAGSYNGSDASIAFPGNVIDIWKPTTLKAGASVTGSIDITGQYLVNGVPFSGGSNGTSGTSGINGTSGTSGLSGTSGTSGVSGTSGTSGVSGTSGTSGINGTSGTSGINGTSGTSGATGASGTSGTSGTSPAGGGGVTQVTGVTFASGSWAVSGSLFEYTYSNTGITTSSFVQVIPNNANVATVISAQILPQVITLAGSMKVYSTYRPTGDIGATINIQSII